METLKLLELIMQLKTIFICIRGRGSKSIVYKSGQKMELKAIFVVLCGHLWSKTILEPSFGRAVEKYTLGVPIYGSGFFLSYKIRTR